MGWHFASLFNPISKLGMNQSKPAYSTPEIISLGRVSEVTAGRKDGEKTDSSGYGTYYLKEDGIIEEAPTLSPQLPAPEVETR